MRIVPQAALFKNRTLGAVRISARAENERGFLRGLLSIAKSPLKSLSLVTLLRDTKESNALHGSGKYE